jgi:nucleolar protein 53
LVEKLGKKGPETNKKVYARKVKPNQPTVDLWAESETVQKPVKIEEELIIEIKPGQRKPSRVQGIPQKKLTVAPGGQSYNPSFSDHQDAVAEALALELKKREEEERNRKTDAPPVLSDLTKLVSVGFDGDESDEEDEYEDENGLLVKRKRTEKLTRAQRNKIRARNIAAHEKAKAKQEKGILKSIDMLPHVLRTLEEEEKYKEEMKKLRETKKKEAMESTAMTYEDAGHVPLSDELRGSLRTLKPKGSTLKIQVSRMRATGDMMRPDRRKRKTYEKPHADKKIKWIPKYKYT